MSNQNSTVSATPANFAADWIGLVDQSIPAKMATFISSFPIAKSISIAELGAIWNGALETAHHAPMSVKLDGNGFSVEAAAGPGTGVNEWYSVTYGTHVVHGNYALLWSVRGPGDGPRPRPCFLFCDGMAVFMDGGEA